MTDSGGSPGESAREILIRAWSDQEIAWISDPVQVCIVGALTKNSQDVNRIYGGENRN